MREGELWYVGHSPPPRPGLDTDLLRPQDLISYRVIEVEPQLTISEAVEGTGKYLPVVSKPTIRN